MFEIIVYFLMAGLMLIGLCDLLHSTWMLILKPKNKTKGIYITYLNGVSDYLSLTQLYEKQKWYGNDFADTVVVVTDTDTNAELREEFSSKGIVFIDKNILTDDFLHLGVLNDKQGIEGNG